MQYLLIENKCLEIKDNLSKSSKHLIWGPCSVLDQTLNGGKLTPKSIKLWKNYWDMLLFDGKIGNITHDDVNFDINRFMQELSLMSHLAQSIG